MITTVATFGNLVAEDLYVPPGSHGCLTRLVKVAGAAVIGKGAERESCTSIAQAHKNRIVIDFNTTTSLASLTRSQ